MFNEADVLIEERLRAQWLQTLIDWDNVEFTPVRGTPFVRLQIEWNTSDVVAVGGVRVRGEGYINLSAFVPSGTGTQDVSKMADDLAGIFDKWDTGKLKFKVAFTQRVGQQEQWFQVDVITPFTYDTCQ